MTPTTHLGDRTRALDWEFINKDLLENGFAITKPLLNIAECKDLRSCYNNEDLYRSTIDMKRYNFGRGSYRYFKYPLPEAVQTLRENFYENLIPAARAWSERLKTDFEYPSTFSQFKKKMEALHQTRPTPLILRYQKDDFNCLHQDINNDLIFPYQVVIGLSEQGRDYEGGHLILTQQRPRMQTVPHIITVPKGAGVIFTSNFHAQLGTRGFYRTVFKHGVGKITAGERFTLGLVFHDYKDK